MKKNGRRNERGVALLFAIGLLSLMIMLCVSFSMESLQSQKNATNNSNRSAAKVLAQSAVNHAALAVLQYQSQQWEKAAGSFSGKVPPVDTSNVVTLGMPVDFSSVVSQTDAGNVNDNVEKDGLKADGNLLPVRGVYAGTLKDDYLKNYQNAENGDSKRAPGWVYVHETANDTTTPIVGRFAYRVLPPASSTQINLDYFLCGNDELTSEEQKKNEDFVSELSMLSFESNQSHELYTALKALVSKNPPYEKTSKNVGSHELFTAANNGIFYASSSVNKNIYNSFIRHFSDGLYAGDIEAFAVRQGNKAWYYHRYDLTGGLEGNSADLINTLTDRTKAELVPYIFGADKIQKSSLNGKAYELKVQAEKDIVSKPHLFFFGMMGKDSDVSSFSDVETRRKQIAANFLDYCDEDNEPTSDSDDWLTKAPSYTGNENTLYINELMAAMKVSAKINEKDNKKLDISVNPLYAAELIDIYGKIDAQTYRLSGGVTYTIEGSCTVTLENDEIKTIDFSKADADKAIEVSFASPVSSGGYHVAKSADNADVITASDGSIALPIKSFSVSINKLSFKFKPYLILNDGTNNVDYSRIPAAEVDLLAGGTATIADAVPRCWAVSNMFAIDPRQNLNVHLTEDGNRSSDWIFNPKVADNTGADAANDKLLGSTMGGAVENGELGDFAGSVNAYSKPNEAKYVKHCKVDDASSVLSKQSKADKENVDDPAYKSDGDNGHMSTAYIANAPMRSFWELGFIHRGAEWETVNLQKSELAQNSFYEYLTGGTFTGISYEEGDAAILDLVKLGPAINSFGMLDVNMMRSAYPGYDYSTADENRVLFHELIANTRMTENLPYRQGTGKESYFTSKKDFEDSVATIAQKTADNFKPETDILLSRSEAAEFFRYKDNSDITDARREEIIGKTMHLLKTGPALVTVFHVDVVAQTIRDIGGVKAAKVKKNGELSALTDTEIGKLDAIDDDGGLLYLDDITGEVKLRATFDCNPYTGKIKLRQIRYLD